MFYNDFYVHLKFIFILIYIFISYSQKVILKITLQIY